MCRQTPKILIVDLIGLQPDHTGRPDHSEVRDHIAARGAIFHEGSVQGVECTSGTAHFFYMPHLSTRAELIAEGGDGRYDAVIAAATFLPPEVRFDLGGVRIGAGTANMGSASWGGGDGKGGVAPLMNTPGINARATAQMVMKALLRLRPDLPVDAMHDLVVAGRLDTGRDLVRFPTSKLEGKRFGVMGYGNIGREVAKLARAFGMQVAIYARPRHRRWVESEGFIFAATPQDAAQGADALSVHLGLGPRTDSGFANAGLIDHHILQALAKNAVVINYDRGELIDITALDEAFHSGQVGHAAIDADLFVDTQSGALSGPMQPYLALVKAHGDKLSLLPHVAADTDHPTRVIGATQAVDQILDAIRHSQLRNLKGDLPDGYSDAGQSLPLGMGGIDTDRLDRLRPDLAQFEQMVAQFHHTLSALQKNGAAQMGEAVMLQANTVAQQLRALGLEGPWRG